MATLDIINFPADNIQWTKDGRKKVHINKEYLITYRIWGWKPEVVDVEKIWEDDSSKDNIKETESYHIESTNVATENSHKEDRVSITNHNKTFTDTNSSNKRTYHHHLAWRWIDDDHTVGEWYVSRTDHRRTEVSGTETHSISGRESYNQTSDSVDNTHTTETEDGNRKSDIEQIGTRELERERVTLRENVLMVLRENTIAIDYRRITSNWPKWRYIRSVILEYERKRGLDLKKVADVSIRNIYII